MGFITSNDIISSNQFGYKKEVSCIDAVVKFNDLVCNLRAKGDIVLTLFLDLSKAFDCVNHSILCSIIERYGVRGVASDLIKSYLRERMQAVAIPDTNNNISLSTFKLVEEGVPQGSIFGPYLFLIYCNCIENLIRGLHCEGILYVDDTNIIISGKSISIIQNKALLILDNIYKFFSSLNLALNIDKTIFMISGRKV